MSYVELARQFIAKKQREQQTTHDVNDLREWFEERAGIMEYDGQLARHEAEKAVLDCMPASIVWPTLPSRNLDGEILDAAWNSFWSRVERLINHKHNGPKESSQ
jgi:serine kinase of HPr protein (carbohydrate metabolism regulator)